MTKPTAQGKAPTRRRNQTVAVGGVLQRRLTSMGLDQDMVTTRLLTNWKNICPLLAYVSQPLSCVKGTLKVAVKSDSVKQELRYHAPALIALINQLLGFEGVNKITATTASWQAATLAPQATSAKPTPPTSQTDLATLQQACKSVADPELREALIKLGRWCPPPKKEPSPK